MIIRIASGQRGRSLTHTLGGEPGAFIIEINFFFVCHTLFNRI